MNAVKPGVVVMGVAGSGKTTLARAIAKRLIYRFIEGDDLHPTGNIAKMSAGIPLTDEDRWPWLARVATTLREEPATVVTCSALKRAYRDWLRREACTPIRFVHVVLDKNQLLRRVGSRVGHYMPASLVDSQLAALETPAGDEEAIEIPGDWPSDRQLEALTTALAR